MKSETPLDSAVFQVSPKRSRCDLFVSSNGNTERLASGLIKPFVTHLKVAEEQFALSVQSIKLEVQKRSRNAETWFTKGTLERFVRFVSTPEILELVNSFDAEMSQLEAARRIYSQGVGDQLAGASSGDGSGTISAADATKKELLRAMDVRLVAVRQDLTTACTRASSAGFNPDTVSELQLFADQFGAHRLNEACSQFSSVCQRRSDLINHLWKTVVDDRAVRSSTGSDMSIDDPTEDHLIPSGSHQPRSHKHHPTGHPQILDQSNSSTCQQPSSSASATFPSRREDSSENNVFVEQEKENKKDKEEEGGTESAPQTIQQQQPTRRLSVQDRISLFENKQKENSGGKPVVVVPKLSELRRLSSDLSSSPAASAITTTVTVPEKAVLRRWSGASDMSIDLSGDKKDVNNSPLCTPSSPSISQDKPHVYSVVSIDEVQVSLNDTVLSAKAEEQKSIGLKDLPDSQTRIGGQNQICSFPVKTEQGDFNNHATSLEKLKITEGVEEQSQFPIKVEEIEIKDRVVSRSRIGDSFRTTVEFASKNKNLLVSHNSQSVPEKLDSFPGLKVEETLPVQIDETDSLEESKTQQMKSQTLGITAPDKLKNSQGKMDKSRKLVFQGKVLESEESSCNLNSKPPIEQAQRVRQSKGNQELNDELKLKANELEKLFAEHMLRVPVDQSTSSRRTKPIEDTQTDQASDLSYTTPGPLPAKSVGTELAFNNIQKLNSTPLMKTPDIHDYSGTKKQNFSDFSSSDDSKGKFYDEYTQKRDAKLREEWSTNRAEKEAKMKAMHDSLERSRSELMARFSGSADRQEAVSNSQRRAEKFRSFNIRSNMKMDKAIEYALGEEEENVPDSRETKPTQARKLFSGRNIPSPTPRTSATQIPRSSTKGSNSIAGRRRVQTENPLAQSVPNFSEFRKENTKPSSVSKVTPRGLPVRNYARSKSSLEEISSSKEEKPRRSNSMRKNFVSVDEPNDQGIYSKFSKNVESKSFLRKGNGIGPGSGSSAAKLKASMASVALRNEDETDDTDFEPEEDLIDMIKEEEDDEEEEEFEVAAEDFADMDSGKPSASQESDKSGNSGSENGDTMRASPVHHHVNVAELPTGVASVFHHLGGSFQDSPGESPIAWNSHMHHSFSYPNEISDIDASVDSPMGSPASWSSHALAQTEADDASRMRKKWGSAHKPIIFSNSTLHQSRKDMTRGFKRLLKFGRKNRGTDSLADWISATTSEGDDDTEDGRDPANRSSDDLRKSRMGFSNSNASDDGFNESGIYNEQVQDLHSSIPAPPANFKLREDHLCGSSLKAPRSFFSLSSFRSKGSESKR